jgi:hypothetical protein
MRRGGVAAPPGLTAALIDVDAGAQAAGKSIRARSRWRLLSRTVHPVGIEHDVLAGCCWSSFRWLLFAVGAKMRTSRCQNYGSTRGIAISRSRSADVTTLGSERSVWSVGCSGLVCTLPGRLRPDRIEWPAARNPGFGFGGGAQRPVRRWRCPWGHRWRYRPPSSHLPSPVPVV